MNCSLHVGDMSVPMPMLKSLHHELGRSTAACWSFLFRLRADLWFNQGLSEVSPVGVHGLLEDISKA